MRKYLFYIEGLNKEIWSEPAESEEAARKQIWNSFTSAEQDQVVVFDWIDVSLALN